MYDKNIFYRFNVFYIFLFVVFFTFLFGEDGYYRIRPYQTWRMKGLYAIHTNLEGFKIVVINEKVMPNFEKPLLHTDKKVNEFVLSFDASRLAIIFDINHQKRLFVLEPKDSSLFSFSRSLGFDDIGPAMTKDGNEIFFASSRFRNFEIFRANVADFNAKKNYTVDFVVDNMTDNRNPSVDYTGNIVAYQSTKRERKPQIYVLDRSTGREVMVSDPLWHCQKPTVSGDGKWVVYESIDNGNYEVYCADLEKQFMINISDNNAIDGLPDIDETGNRIVFRSDRNRANDIFLYDVSSNIIIDLTHNIKSDDNYPSISADGRIVSFESAEKWISHCVKVIDFNLKVVFMFWDNKRFRTRPILSKDGNVLVYYREDVLYTIDLKKVRESYGTLPDKSPDRQSAKDDEDVFQINKDNK